MVILVNVLQTWLKSPVGTSIRDVRMKGGRTVRQTGISSYIDICNMAVFRQTSKLSKLLQSSVGQTYYLNTIANSRNKRLG